MITQDYPPGSPGSDEAHELGCSCPRMDNARGLGYMGGMKGPDGGTLFVVVADCPTHPWPEVVDP